MDTDPVRPQSIQDQMYLEACYIYLSPEFPADRATRLKKMIRMGGGIQVTEYQPSEVTHVVVPSDTLDDRLVVHGRLWFNLPRLASLYILTICFAPVFA